jgi:hypothetical protein
LAGTSSLHVAAEADQCLDEAIACQQRGYKSTVSSGAVSSCRADQHGQILKELNTRKTKISSNDIRMLDQHGQLLKELNTRKTKISSNDIRMPDQHGQLLKGLNTRKTKISSNDIRMQDGSATGSRSRSYHDGNGGYRRDRSSSSLTRSEGHRHSTKRDKSKINSNMSKYRLQNGDPVAMSMKEVISLLSGKYLFAADFPPVFVGAPISKSSVIPGASSTIYALNILSWFWVPAILMALPVSISASLEDIDAILAASGAMFKMHDVVTAIQNLLVDGRFQLFWGDVVTVTRAKRVKDWNSCICIEAAAQERLRQLLSASEPNLMHAVSGWIHHLYFCEVHYLQRGVGNLIEADGWIAHSYMHETLQVPVHVPAPDTGTQFAVAVGEQRNTDDASLRAELVAAGIQVRKRANRGEILMQRLRLMRQATEVGELMQV